MLREFKKLFETAEFSFLFIKGKGIGVVFAFLAVLAVLLLFALTNEPIFQASLEAVLQRYLEND